ATQIRRPSRMSRLPPASASPNKGIIHSSGLNLVRTEPQGAVGRLDLAGACRLARPGQANEQEETRSRCHHGLPRAVHGCCSMASVISPSRSPVRWRLPSESVSQLYQVLPWLTCTGGRLVNAMPSHLTP